MKGQLIFKEFSVCKFMSLATILLVYDLFI